MDSESKAKDLRFLIQVLFEERGVADDRAEEMIENCSNEEDLFNLFRGLVNTRPAEPAREDFIAVQDRLLQAMLQDAGITDAYSLSRCELDPRLSLWRGDITRLAVDAVVNAANSEMLGCWIPGHHCIDNAIHTFAGVQLRIECSRLMRMQGHPEPTGRAKVTPAYNLPARFVIHTVGPIVSGALTKTEEMLLAQCYASCLEAAADVGCKSIAFCCISTGVFGFPQKEAAKIAVNTVRDWLDAHEYDMHVIFDVFGQDDETIYRSILSGER